MATFIGYLLKSFALSNIPASMQAIDTGADGHQTYQDAARTPQAMRHMTNKLGVEKVSA